MQLFNPILSDGSQVLMEWRIHLQVLILSTGFVHLNYLHEDL